jgi:prepilin-type N-terminal cleavage/methylation domain-containing protein
MIKNLKMKKSAFTLVELLVVIAIIGLLSTIVLVSFGPIRDTASDTAIKANMNQIRLAAEMEFNDESSYADTDTRPDYQAAKQAIIDAGGAFTPTDPDTGFSTSKWCIQSSLKGDDPASWCIDYEGRIGVPSGSCDITNFNCS